MAVFILLIVFENGILKEKEIKTYLLAIEVFNLNC